MGLWKLAKTAVTTALDHIEGKPTGKQYKSHPDSAYLGNKYYAKDKQVVPNAPDARASGNLYTPAALPSLGKQSSDPKDKEQCTGIIQPHVQIGAKPVRTPLQLPGERYTVLRHSDLIDDDKIERTVDRDRDLYWVIKGAVVLMVKERSERASTPAKVQKKSPKESTRKTSGIADGVGAPNPLNSPSIEDFFADSFDTDRYSPIDVLPPNPLAKGSRAAQTLNPLDCIPWSELVILFRRDTKEIFVRKQNGDLYPVIWTVRAMHSRLKNNKGDSHVAAGVKYTSVDGENEVEDYVDVEYV